MILSSPILADDRGIPEEAMGDAGAPGAGAGAFEFGVDPSLDPELAMVRRTIPETRRAESLMRCMCICRRCVCPWRKSRRAKPQLHRPPHKSQEALLPLHRRPPLHKRRDQHRRLRNLRRWLLRTRTRRTRMPCSHERWRCHKDRMWKWRRRRAKKMRSGGLWSRAQRGTTSRNERMLFPLACSWFAAR